MFQLIIRKLSAPHLGADKMHRVRRKIPPGCLPELQGYAKQIAVVKLNVVAPPMVRLFLGELMRCYSLLKLVAGRSQVSDRSAFRSCDYLSGLGYMIGNLIKVL